MTGVPLEELPEGPRAAWVALRDALQEILGDDLVAIWAYGGTTAVGDPPHPADLDTYVVLARRPDEATVQKIEDAQDAIARDRRIDWDISYILAADTGRQDPAPHAYRADRRDTSWGLNRAHWLAGRFAGVFGPEPAAMVAVPTWEELQSELDRELEHIERHVVEGHTDPYEAAYAVLNGSRLLHAIETRDIGMSKRAAGPWALEHLPARWHPAVKAAIRSYDGRPVPGDHELLAAERAPFVAFVRTRVPTTEHRPAGEPPRWSGY